MYCHKCGVKLIEGGKFCQSCGTAVAPDGAENDAQGSPTTAIKNSSAHAQTIGSVIGEVVLIPYVSILFKSESEAVEPPWKDGTVDLLVTDNALIFYPTHRSHSLKKSVMKISKYAMPIGGFLLVGAGPIGVAIGTALGGGVEAIAKMASKGNDSMNKPDDQLVDDLPFDQAVICLKQEIVVKAYDVKGKGWLASTERKFAIEGKVHFSDSTVMDVTLLPGYNGSDGYTKLLKNAGYINDASSIKCSEIEYVDSIRSAYPYPRLMTYDERVKRMEQVMREMKEEEKNK